MSGENQCSLHTTYKYGMFLQISHEASTEPIRIAVFPVSILWVTLHRQGRQISSQPLQDQFTRATPSNSHYILIVIVCIAFSCSDLFNSEEDSLIFIWKLLVQFWTVALQCNCFLKNNIKCLSKNTGNWSLVSDD